MTNWGLMNARATFARNSVRTDPALRFTGSDSAVQARLRGAGCRSAMIGHPGRTDAMTTSDATAPSKAARRVTFPDLVRIHHRWRKTVRDGSGATPEEREAVDAEYHAALDTFEDEHGQVISAYWCADFESAVALTAGAPRTGWLRRWRSPPPRLHRVSDWATKEDPQIARMLHQCDELAIRSAEVLRGRSRRICIQLVMTSACHLLSLVDARHIRTDPKTHAAAVADEKRELELVAEDYRQAANGDAQLIYFGGMAIGVAFISLLYLVSRGILQGEDVQDATIIGCLVAGALGAVVSVIARINSGSFDLDADVARGYTLFLGALRPWIGSIFGVLTYFAVTSGFVEVFKIPPDGIKQFYFLCVIAFGAGFSERWAQDTLTGGLTGRSRKADPPSPTAPSSVRPPAAPPPPAGTDVKPAAAAGAPPSAGLVDE